MDPSTLYMTYTPPNHHHHNQGANGEGGGGGAGGAASGNGGGYIAPTSSSSSSVVSVIGNGSQLPQGSKLATYMRGYSTQLQPQQQQQQKQPQQGQGGNNESGDIISKSLLETNFRKLSIQSIPEFVPVSGNGYSSTAARYNPIPSAANDYGMKLNVPPTYSMAPSTNSPRESPTPSSTATEDPSMAAAAAAAAYYNDGGTTYFYSSGEEMQHMVPTASTASGSVIMPNFAVYAGTPSHVASMRTRSNVPGCLADNELKLDVLKRQQICQSQTDPESFPNLPTEVDNFQQICPLEPPPLNPLQKSHTFGYVTSVYKATNVKNGLYVCLRRIHGFRLVNTKCMVLVEQWKKLLHSNLISLRQVFTTKSFGDHSMVFVYDFYPGAETLMVKQFNNPNQITNSFIDPYSDGSRPYSQMKSQMLRQQQQQVLLSSTTTQSGPLPESLIWTYIIQLTSALRHIHSSGLAYRTLDPTKILVINKTRLLLNCGGIFDVLTFDPNSSNPMATIAHYQQEDLISLGKIVLALACNSFLAIQRENLQTSMEIVTSTYSSDLRNLIMYLLTNPNRIKSVNDLMPMIGARFYSQLDAAYMRNDQIEAEMAKDIESARLFRLLTKLSTIVDRAELNHDFEWAEYGDRYMLKLFRDYVFHQVMENNRPWMDMAHIISCLNKLDAGVPDKVCLMSRDEQNVLVVSYQELRRCLEQSFAECIQAATATTSASAGVASSSAGANVAAVSGITY